MTRQDAIIKGLGGAINSTDTPDATSISFSNGGSLEYITRMYHGVTYLFVLNMSSAEVETSLQPNFAIPSFDLQVIGEDRDLTTLEANGFIDRFDPYGMHVYAEVPIGLSALEVPEPTGVLVPIAAFALLRAVAVTAIMAMRESPQNLHRISAGSPKNLHDRLCA